MIRPLLFALVGLAASPLAAQTPDTTNAARYAPLAVGNEWHATETYNNGYWTDYAQVRSVVTGTNGGVPERFTVVWLRRYQQFPDSPVVTTTGTYETYFDPATATPNGSLTACRLDAPFGAPTTCGTRTFAVSGGHGQTVTIGSQSVVTTRKEFRYAVSNPQGPGFYEQRSVVAAGIGSLRFTEDQFNGTDLTQRAHTLRYARIGTRTFGSPLTFPTAGGDAPEATALALSVGPNPAGASATARFTLGAPAHVRLTVTDVLGREVARPVDAARPAGTHAAALGVATFAPGVYDVRLTVTGQTLVRRVTVVR